jgi:hypothetical protein
MEIVKIALPIRRLMLKSFHSIIPSVEGIEMIRNEAMVVYDDQIIAIYKKANSDVAPLLNACLSLNFPEYERVSGLLTQTLNVNASPRNGKRLNKCMRTKFRRQFPRTHRLFLEYARTIAKDYRKHFPVHYAEQVKRMYIGKHKVHRAYRIKGTPFTSAVINKNSALRYHRDQANTEHGISCMLCLKGGIAGGELILPELNLGFECENGYMLLFDGHKYIHGVTPIIRPQVGISYRYTIVYYNNKGMSLCLPPKEEDKRRKLSVNQ